jgi:hypothetical protein
MNKLPLCLFFYSGSTPSKMERKTRKERDGKKDVGQQ